MPVLFNEDHTQVLKYPYEIYQLLEDNKDVSWPEIIPVELAEEYHVFDVSPVEKPNVNPATHGVSEKDPVFVDGVCTQSWDVWEYTPEELQSLSSALKEKLKEEATQKRWDVETGGILLPDGTEIKTGIDDKNRITTVIVNARLAGLTEVNFKTASGWVTMSIEQIEGIAAVIGNHTHLCFNAEMQHHLLIDTLDYSALLQYDMLAFWPS